MTIVLYEDWMKPQIVKLFGDQYGIKEEDFSLLIDRFYEHPYQKNKCLRIVALDDKKVIGFQSFFYWPYNYASKIYNSYQSGNSLVHPDYRGKGIFQKLLNYIDNQQKELKIDFLMGFPVEDSFKSFIKNNWHNSLNLNWHVKIINPFGFLFSLKNCSAHFQSEPVVLTDSILNNQFRLSSDASFEDWRNAYRNTIPTFFYNYSEGNKKITFYLKTNKRNKWLNELILGDIRSNTYEKEFITRALKKLRKKTFTCFSISIISIALNDHSNTIIQECLIKSGYRKIKKSIYFITKAFTEKELVEDPKNWVLYRGDIDTW